MAETEIGPEEHVQHEPERDTDLPKSSKSPASLPACKKSKAKAKVQPTVPSKRAKKASAWDPFH